MLLVDEKGMQFAGYRELMSDAPADRLLQPGDPPPVMTVNASGASPFLIVCDHAGRHLPIALGSLGLPEDELRRHIAWDIGAWGVSRELSLRLDAAVIGQAYSRLVIDCNRAIGHPTSIARRSEATDIAGNLSVSEAERSDRAAAIFTPYHQAITAALDRRQAAGRESVVIAMHSFTPVFHGVARPWHAGVLFNRDPRLALALAALLRKEPGLVIGENEPYQLSDGSDYTIPVHAEQRGLIHVEIEVRQDLIAEPAGQTAWADRLARLLPQALATLTG